MQEKRIPFVLCRVCGEPFPLRRNHRRAEYCGDGCRLAALRLLSRARATERLRRVSTTGDDCWEYRFWQTGRGYGRVWIGATTMHAHRFAWELAYGPVPSGMLVCHRCDNPPCVNPEHLFLGTPRDNARDRDAKGRHRGNVKISPTDREDIRALHAAGMSQAAIARKYAVSKPTITRALSH